MPVPFGGGVPVMQGERRSYEERRRTDADVFPCAGRKGMVRMLSFHRRQYHEKGGHRPACSRRRSPPAGGPQYEKTLRRAAA